MKRYFECNLAAKHFARQFLPIYAGFVAGYLLIILGTIQGAENAQEMNFGLYFLGLIIVIFSGILLYFVIYKATAEHISYRDKVFEFHGKLGRYFGLNLKWLLFTAITFGIFGPWYYEKYLSYMLENTNYNEHSFIFLGKGGRLFVIMLLALVVPIIIISLLLQPSITRNTESFFFQMIFNLFIYLLLIPAYYLIYKWMVDIRYRKKRIYWDTEFLESIGEIFKEFLLTIITFGVFAPAASLRLLRYFMRRTCVAETEGFEKKYLGFDGDIRKGFGFLWGQILLTIVTAGFYFPWSYSKVIGWLIRTSYVEEKEATATG